MNRDREEALDLAARSAQALQLLAAGGKSDVSGAVETLAGTLGNRPDAIVVPALGVLEFLGGAAQIEVVTAVVTNAERTEAARAAAANALSGIFSRAGSADASVIQRLQEIAKMEGSFSVRGATAGALGRLNLTKDARVELMHGLLGR